MPDNMEKVISGLTHCAYDGCVGCPYGDDCAMCERFEALARDAIALLKAQEPRVLTLGEVEALTADPFLVETRGGKLTWATYYAEYTYYGALMARMVDFDGEVDDRIKGDYGRLWRCWSARPSDERRRAEAWEKS